MPRFRERGLQWGDIICRFESGSYSIHHHNARGLIESLRDEARRFWDRDSQQFRKWGKYCTDLLVFLNDSSRRRNFMKQNLETAMREFIQNFEHSTSRMYQMLYGASADPTNDEEVHQIMEHFHWVFRVSVYALVSAWIDDKQETNSLRTTINVTTGKMTVEGSRVGMRVPKRYRNGTKRL